MKLRIKQHSLGSGAFSLAELMIAATVFGVVMAAVYATNTALIDSMTASQNYSVGQLQAMDYISLDLRRANSLPNFGNDHGTLTLPLKLYLPQYYQADGHTPNPPQRVLVSSLNKKE